MAKQTLTREQQMLTDKQREDLRYFKNGQPPKRKKRMSNAEAEAMARETGVTVEEIRAMENEAANEASASGYKKGGMVKAANCGASMKPTQKSTSAVKMSCGGMSHSKKGKK